MSSSRQIPKGVAVFVCCLPWVAAAAVFGWILLQRFPPSGVFVTTSVMDGKSAFINPFLPSERVSVPGAQPDGWVGQRITGDPTYASARIPGSYNQARVTVEYRPIHQPLIEFGVMKGGDANNLDLVPMYSSELASTNWHEADGGFVFQSTPVTRIQSANPDGVATWDATAQTSLANDPPASEQQTAVSLRGAHDFYFIPSDGKIAVTFGIQDVNRVKGSSTVSIRVFRGEEELSRDTFEANGSQEKTMGTVIERRIAITNAVPSVYRISLSMSDDVFIRFIRTASRRWVVGPRLVFGDVVGYATTTAPAIAWTTSRHLVVETFHVEGLQTVALDHNTVTVRRTHEPVRLDRTDADAGPVRLDAPRGDVRIIGDGFFALRPDAFFEPKPKRLTDATQLVTEHIVGVLTPYIRPKDLGNGWLQSTFQFELEPSQDVLRFVLSAPGIASRAGAVDIRRITIEYHRDDLSVKAWVALIVQEAKNAWHRL